VQCHICAFLTHIGGCAVFYRIFSYFFFRNNIISDGFLLSLFFISGASLCELKSELCKPQNGV
jgi:hypothetical protein